MLVDNGVKGFAMSSSWIYVEFFKALQGLCSAVTDPRLAVLSACLTGGFCQSWNPGGPEKHAMGMDDRHFSNQ